MNDYRNEYITIENDLILIQNRLADYPKGSLRKRIIKGREYVYLQYREGKHVRSQYVRSEDVDGLSLRIEERQELERQAKRLKKRMVMYAKLLGMHITYRPVRNVDYEDYTLFMSQVAHDYKSLDTDAFAQKYVMSKYRGIKKRYLAGFLDYINGIEQSAIRRTNDLVLDPYTYLMYFKYDNKEVLNEELKKAIPAFLCRGLLITNVQEAVNVARG